MSEVFHQLEILRSPAWARDSRAVGVTGLQRANKGNRSSAGAGVLIGRSIVIDLGSFADSKPNSPFSKADQRRQS
jgi:hypothetical protein